MPNFTQEQLTAIEARHSSLLLSAAAGSGKTTVLVERILRLLEQDGARLDRMLVVTFTRAAASDMRAKLSSNLVKRAHETGSENLQEQLYLLESASITTLHSFCSEFLRAHFESAGVSPSFHIMDEAVADRLMQEALDEVLQEAYEQADEALLSLDYGRGPQVLREMIRSLWKALEERADPGAWIARAADPAMLSLWEEELLRDARRALEEAATRLEEALATPGCSVGQRAAIASDLENLLALKDIRDYETLRTSLSAFTWQRAKPAKKGEEVDPEAKELAKSLREQAKKALSGAHILDHPLEQARQDALSSLMQIRRLGELAMAVGERFGEKKAAEAALTYGDLEQKTMRALQDDAVAEAVRARYDYVFVDEYQDTSDLQEAIVRRITPGDNLFMVGDVKQSIYRFRQAEPTLFLEKYAQYRAGKGGVLLPLTRNFRSKKAILDFVNLVFERCMVGGDSEIEYDELARLNPGREDADSGAPVEIHLVDGAGEAPEPEAPDEPLPPEDNDGENAPDEADEGVTLEDLKDAEREARIIGMRIRQLRSEDPELHYSDIAILTRTRATASTLLAVLRDMDIPIYADVGDSYFDRLEVRLTLDLLRLVARRRSDVALIGALRFPSVGLTNEDLARFRVACPSGAFADAVWRYAFGTDTGVFPEEGEPLPEGDAAVRARRFLLQLEHWRALSGAMSLGELTRTILDESGVFLYFGAQKDGAQRQANLNHLVALAEQYDASTSGSVLRFLGYAEQLRQRGDGESAHVLGENDDVVRLMTIHKSKGLEFRVVFGALLSRHYRGQRAEGLMTHRDLGVGMYWFDPALRSRRKTMAQAAIQLRSAREDSAEEMRVLYVLLTRAMERLILVGSVKDLKKAQLEWRIAGHALPLAKNHLALIMGARAEAEDEDWDGVCTVVRHGPQERWGAPAPGTQAEDEEAEAASEEALLREMRWTYPDPLGAGKPLKLSVSGLIRQVGGPQQLPERIEKPQFLQEAASGRLSGAERGTAWHRTMQLLDLEALNGLAGDAVAAAIAGQLRAFVQGRRMTKEQADAVRPERLAAFLLSPWGLRMRQSPELHREWSFNVTLRAGEALTLAEAGRYADEDLLVQGTIDCCFIEDGEWVLMDYKTDRSDDTEALLGRYRPQLNVYALALERITGRKVKKKLLCLLGMGRVLEAE